ncbi:MAG: AMP-dependent synthetase/ligase, partial [Candidatus Acidiferrales bacterium]
FLHRAAALAATLQRLGVKKGDRVGLFSENRPEWSIADFALLGLGALNVPVYPAESVDRLTFILRHSEARLCFVSGADQFEKVKAAWNNLPHLEAIIPFVPVGDAPSGRRVVSWAEAAPESAGPSALAGFERTARSLAPADLATLIYTSGTTGTPKGALLTQNNFASNVLGVQAVLPYGGDDTALSLLPLCHIFERTNLYAYLTQGTSIAYAESFDNVADNLLEVRPTVMAVVPRFFEKLYARLMEKVQAAPAPRRKLFDWAVAVGRRATPYRLDARPLPFALALQYRLAEALVYRKLRAQLGGRIRCIISGGAPLARGLNEFFHALGLTIFEGYGLTETSPVISVNVPGAARLGTVGRPIPGVEVKIADDGEILSRGPHIMAGYFKNPEATAETIRDGWFYTGDIGALDPDGFLAVTDRKKDLFKTAGGKFIAPQPLENRLKQSPYIQNAVVIGDRRKFAVVLLVPNQKTLEQFAAERGLAHRSPAELYALPAVRAVLQAEVDSVNEHLAQYEKLKRFALLEHDFTFDAGQLTYTQKLRRRQIEEQYRDLIESLFADDPVPTR